MRRRQNRGMSASPVRISARAFGAPNTNDCSDLKVREAVNAELDALPFLGSLTCQTSRSSRDNPGAGLHLHRRPVGNRRQRVAQAVFPLLFRLGSANQRPASARLRHGAADQPIADRAGIARLGGHGAAARDPLRRQRRRTPVPEGAVDPCGRRIPAARRCRRNPAGRPALRWAGHPGTDLRRRRLRGASVRGSAGHLPDGTRGRSLLAVIPGPPRTSGGTRSAPGASRLRNRRTAHAPTRPLGKRLPRCHRRRAGPGGRDDLASADFRPTGWATAR